MKITENKVQIQSYIGLWLELLSRAKMSSWVFVIPALLMMIKAVFNAISLALLIPVARGIFEKDFSFIIDIPVLGYFVGMASKYVTFANNHYLFVLLLIILLSTTVKTLLEYMSMMILSYYSETLASRLKVHIFSRYLSFGKLFFDQFNAGKLNGVLWFSDKLPKLASYTSQIMNKFLTLFAYIGVMLLISWKITFLSIIIFPILYLVLTKLIKRIKKRAEMSTKHMLRVSEKIFNILSCASLVHASNQIMGERRSFKFLSASLRRLRLRVAQRHNLIAPFQELISVISILALFSVLAILMMGNRSGEISGLLVFVYLVKSAMPLFTSINSDRAEIATLVPPAAELVHFFSKKYDKYMLPDGNEEFVGLERGIEFDRLTYGYTDKRTILRNISFSITRKQVTAIVGPSGSGKTTLIHLLMRFYQCPPRSIFIDNKDIREFSISSLRDRIAYVGQDAMLFNDTLRNNITYGLKKVDEDLLKGAIRQARLEELVKSLPQGLETEIGDRGVQLSGGEKQRVSIARAILKRSDIVILDEATSALDTRAEQLIQQAIDDVLRDKTAIVIAHRLSTIQNADKVIVVDRGCLVEEGNFWELIRKEGVFYQYWQAQKIKNEAPIASTS